MPASATLSKDLHLVPFRSPCRGCTTEHLCLPRHLDLEQERDLSAVIRRRDSFGRGDRIFSMGAPFTSLFVVQSGSVKTQQLTVDGNLSLTGFYLEGELFGLDAIGSPSYPCEAIALQSTTVCALPYGELERLCSGIPLLQRWLLNRLGGG